MDFGSAALLIGSVYIIVELVGRVFPVLTAASKVIIALVAAQIAVELVAHSAWGAKQIVEGVPLNSMNAASLVLVGLALAGLTTIGKQGLNAVRNIGENQPTRD